MNKNYELLNLEKYKMELEILRETKSNLSNLIYKIRPNNGAYAIIDSFIDDIEEKIKKLTEIIKDLMDSNQEGIIELKIEICLFKQLQTKRTEFKLDSLNRTIEYLINYQDDDVFFNKLTKIEKYSPKEFEIEQYKNTKFNFAFAKKIDQLIVYHQDDIYVKNNDIYLDLNNFDISSHKYLKEFLFSRLFNLHDINIFLKM